MLKYAVVYQNGVPMGALRIGEGVLERINVRARVETRHDRWVYIIGTAEMHVMKDTPTTWKWNGGCDSPTATSVVPMSA